MKATIYFSLLNFFFLFSSYCITKLWWHFYTTCNSRMPVVKLSIVQRMIFQVV